MLFCNILFFFMVFRISCIDTDNKNVDIYTDSWLQFGFLLMSV
jgi:hypothetical protein